MKIGTADFLYSAIAVSFLVFPISTVALDSEWLYAGAFKVENARYCLALEEGAEKNQCFSESFTKDLLKKENVAEQLSLIGYTAGKKIRECTETELNKAVLGSAQKNEIYGCLPLQFERTSLKGGVKFSVKPYRKKYAKLILKFEQQTDKTLLISGIKPSDKTLALVCEDFEWDDVLKLAQPYLSDFLYTALVMQGESSEYRLSAAASQAMDDSLPEPVRKILQAMIDADC